MEETILVIDDNLFYGQLIAYMVSRNTPYHTRCVQTGSQALTAAKSITPILFLLDYELPDMNGIELYDQLCEIEGRALVPAILLSANLPDRSLEEQLAGRKMIGISKPCQLSLLLLTIELLVAKYNYKPG